MSVNTSQHELIVLIFRYLKENGFHSAAEELLRHSPQEFVVGTTGISSSLVEIYSSWLKHSGKNKYSSSNGEGSTQIKAASKKGKSAKKAQKRKLVLPKEEKKDWKLSKTVTPAKTLTKQQNAVTAGDVEGDGDSDSDSSLDVDKWKKMLLQMTDVDVAKMDNINALDSSAAKPVKKRARKTQAKPKTDMPSKKPTAKKSDVLEKAVMEEQAKSSPPKKTTQRTGTAPEPPLATLNGTQDLMSSDEGRTSSSTKETKKKEKKKVLTPIGEKAEAPKVQHKKKKKKESSEREVGESTRENVSEEKEVVKPERMGKPAEDIANCSTESQDERVEVNTIVNAEEVKRKEKKAKKREKEPADNQNISETLRKDKKSKKKKKRDGDEEKISEPVETVDSVKGSKHVSQQENSDQMDDDEEARRNAETARCMGTPNTDVREKKAKEKKRDSHPVEGTPQMVNNETKRKRKKDKANPDQEQIVEDENRSVNVEEIAEPNTEVKKKKKRKLGSLDAVPLFTLETPSPSSQKKKKKIKVDSDEFPATLPTA